MPGWYSAPPIVHYGHEDEDDDQKRRDESAGASVEEHEVNGRRSSPGAEAGRAPWTWEFVLAFAGTT